ncbi:HAMP domain-containing sensor histidine kinase [Bacillus sp. JJ722]
MYILAFAILIISTVSIILWYRKKTIHTMNRLHALLDSAISGRLIDTQYNESQLASLEAKMNRYLKLVQNEKEKSVTEKDTIKSLISDIAHQIKTPIANVILYSQLLQEQNDLSDHNKIMTNFIHNEAEKLNFLITSLIHTSRLENGLINVSPKMNSVDELLSVVCREQESKASLKKIKIEFTKHNVNGMFDYKWTLEAVSNILDNAIKYSKNGSTIHISSTEYEMFYSIDIKDNGIGIKEEEIAQIFKRFYRSHNVKEIEGVGIGLYLAREIITSQHGYIKVSSVVGSGSTFSIFLPRKN